MLNGLMDTICAAEYLETLRNLSEGGCLVTVILNSYPMGWEIPSEIESKIRNVRIIHVGEDHLVLGPKKPICEVIVPLQEISSIMISEKEYRDDEDEIDIIIASAMVESEAQDHSYCESTGCQSSKGFGSVIDVTSEEFWHFVDTSSYVVVQIYAEWCKPCKEVSKVVAGLSGAFADEAVFLRLDGDSAPEIEEDLEIREYPTVVLFKNGQVCMRIVGYR